MGEYYKATSVDDAYSRIEAADGYTELIAGGQTLMLNIRQGLKNPDLLVDIKDVDELNGITASDSTVTVGSCVTYSELKESPLIEREFPYLVEAVGNIAGPQVRNNGTLGGGLCYGDPALDTPPVLLTLDAEVTAVADGDRRTIPLSEFYTGYYETALRPDEILTAVAIPKLPRRSAGTYRSMTPRQGDYAAAGVAVRLTFDGSDTCHTARVALTNAGDVPLRVESAETTLEGTTVGGGHIDDAVAAVVADLDLLEDTQTPKAYRERVFARLTEQSLRDVRDRVLEGDDE